MEILRRAFYTTYKIYVGLVFLISMVPFYPVFWLLLKLKRYKATLWLEHFWAKMFLPIMGIFINKIDFPQLEQPVIICPNHSSYFDIFVSIRVMPMPYSFMGKAELKTWPIFNSFFNSGLNILVDRENKLGSAKAFRQAMKKIDLGYHLIIFPEGTFSSDVPMLKEFKDGAFALAIKKQIPILPVTFLDNYKRFRTGGFFKSKATPGVCRVIFHDIIQTEGLTQADLVNLRQLVFDTIQKPIIEDGNR